MAACVSELGATAERFSSARDEAMASLAQHLRPQLRSAVTDLVGVDTPASQSASKSSTAAAAEGIARSGGGGGSGGGGRAAVAGSGGPAAGSSYPPGSLAAFFELDERG